MAAEREGLREALANAISDIMLERGAHFPKRFADRLLAGPVLSDLLTKADNAERMEVERDEARAENDRLRASLANGGGPCAYCSLPREEWSKCISGFPGCGRADDAMLCPHVGVELETADKLTATQADLARLTAEVEAKDRRIAELSETWTDESGTPWSPPTAYAYARACAALHGHRAEAEALKAALRDIAQQDRGGVQNIYDDGGGDDEVIQYLFRRIHARCQIARTALSRAADKAETEGVEHGE